MQGISDEVQLSFTSRWQPGDPFIFIEGQTTNLTDTNLGSVLVTANLFDKHGTFITHEQSLLVFKPLLSRQTSPYKVMIPYNPEIATYSLHFSDMNGKQFSAKQSQ